MKIVNRQETRIEYKIPKWTYCRVGWKRNSTSTYVIKEVSNKHISPVENVDIIDKDKDDDNYNEIFSMTNFHENKFKNYDVEHPKMVDVIVYLDDSNLNYILNQENTIPINIIYTFLRLLNYLHHKVYNIIIHPMVTN